MDDAMFTTFAVVYSVIFCTNLSIMERRAAFQQQNLLLNMFSVAINAIIPTLFCFSVFYCFPLTHDKLGVVREVFLMAWYCSVPFGASHLWLIIVRGLKLRLYVATHEAKDGQARMIPADELRQYISVSKELWAIAITLIFPILVQVYFGWPPK